MRDDDLARWFAGLRTPTLDTVAEVGTFLGDTLAGIVALLLLGVGFSLWRRTWVPLAFVAVGYGGLLGVYLVATQLDPRDRPPVEILDRGLVPDHSFPSGHTMTSTAVVWTLLLLLWTFTRVPRAATLLLAAVPVFTLVARMYQGAHHLTDVLTALLFALAWLSAVTLLLFRPPTGSRRSHPTPPRVREAPHPDRVEQPRRARPARRRATPPGARRPGHRC